MEGGDEQPPPPSFSSSSLKDISNFKTPKRPSRNPDFHSPFPNYFTASKQTPSSSSFRNRTRTRPSLAPPSARSKAAARRLKEFELEQSQSSRKAQIKKEQSLKSLSKSLTVWLNFLFQNPRSCGCDVSINGQDGYEVGVGSAWRNPKRMRELGWKGEDVESVVGDFSGSKYSSLRSSLNDVCSFDDLKQRMRIYLSLGSCKEIFDVMTHVTKNIDEGRLKMKAHCPIVTDVGMKEKATRILMSYNPIWLRIGLYIIFGGDSLLLDGNVSSEQEKTFLKMVIEKQIFSHVGLAKAYAYNKMVEGLYRPGYYENLGNIILKRFLLFVLILDRAKSQSSLPLKFGIDGADGGSPILFTVQSSIKSSCKVISDFLSSDVMHGEGNLLAHLVIVGYKVSYQQPLLVEFDFRVSDLFVDLQDGLRLCRAIQLLKHDPSILMKLTVPSDSQKKNLANCGVALQYLRQAGVSLNDDDGVTIMGDDVANGDKELTLSLLWNMFVHLQLPLLVNKRIVAEEISKVRGTDTVQVNVPSYPPLEMLLKWIQAVCEKYDLSIDSFSSLINGKAIWCLLDYYFHRELSSPCSQKGSHGTRGEESILSPTDYTDAVHNFVLCQKLTTLLGNFPEVLQISDLLEHNGAVSERSLVVLLVFLSSQLIAKKNLDQLNFHKLFGCHCQNPERRRSYIQQWPASSGTVMHDEEIDGDSTEDSSKKFKAIQAWWRDMTERNQKSAVKPASSTLQCSTSCKESIDVRRENAAIVIQSCFRKMIDRQSFQKMKNAISLLQIVIRLWLTVKRHSMHSIFSSIKVQEYPCETIERHVKLIIDRHHFLKLRKSALLIQQAARIWIAQRSDASFPALVKAATILQSYIRGLTARSRYIHRVAEFKRASLTCQENDHGIIEIEAATTIQIAWKNFICRSLHEQVLAATQIQSHFRSWLLRRRFLNQKKAIIKIQSAYRSLRCWKAFHQYKTANMSAIIIQSHIRRWIARRGALRYKSLVIAIQSHCRGWLVRKEIFFLREAAVKIQTAIRCMTCWKEFHCQKDAALEIQRFVRGQISRNKLLGASSLRAVIASSCDFKKSRRCFQSAELEIVLASVLKVQRWWKGVLFLKLRTKSAIVIQCHIRGWIARRKVSRERHRIVVIQSYWKGCIARKESRGRLMDLRLRVQKSAANVDDSKRLINRLLSALSELLNMKSVSRILHNCATLDMATGHSQKCCEELVAAGAVGILLELIRTVSRSVPDQEVLKHSLSTLRNLACYKHLLEVLIDTRGSVEIIFRELLRNKEEGYFIASEVLKKICSNQKGIEAVHKLPALLKRLQNLVEELSRKAMAEKRNARALPMRENTERRLKEASELLKLMTKGHL